MRIAFDGTALRPRRTGVGYYTEHLLHHLAVEATNDELIVVSNRPIETTAPLPRRVRIATPSWNAPRLVWMQALAPTALREVEADVAHFTNGMLPLASPVPTVVTIHDMSLKLYPRYHPMRRVLLNGPLVDWSARRADAIITPSESAKKDIVRLYHLDPHRVHVVYEAAAPSFKRVEDAAELERVRRLYGLEERVILYVGTIEPRKNLPKLISAFAARRRAGHLTHQLVCVGPYGWLSHGLEQLIASSNVAHAVNFTGYVPFDDLPALYSLAEMFVYPSMYEGFGLPVIEAMACGVPVITGRTAALAEIGGGATEHVDRIEAAELGDMLVALAGSRDRREERSSAGLERARTFSWQRAAQESLEVYRETASQRASQRVRPASPAALAPPSAGRTTAVPSSSAAAADVSVRPGVASVDVLFGQAYFLRFDPKLWAAQAALCTARGALRGRLRPRSRLSRGAFRRDARGLGERMGRRARSPSPTGRGDLRGQFQLPEQDVPPAHASGGADDDRRGARPGHPDHRCRLGRDRSPLHIPRPRRRHRCRRRRRGHARRGARRPLREGGRLSCECQRPRACATPRAAMIRTGPRDIIRDLDALPFPAWDLVDIERYQSIWRPHHGYYSMNLVTTRGCPYHCNWCAKPIYGQRYNARSPEHVVEEMAWLKQTFHPDHLWIADDIFGLKPRWIERFAELLAARDAAIPFKCLLRADQVTAEVARSLSAARCQTAWIGAESGSQRILDAMEKGTRVEDIAAATRLLHDAGVEVGFFLQFGYPGETREDIDRTLQMVRDCGPDDIGVSVSYPLPGTTFYQRVRAQLGPKQNWVDSNDLAMMYHATYVPDFYRALHALVHAEFRARKSTASLLRVLGRPWTWRGRHARLAATVGYHRAKMPLLRRRLSRLARLTALTPPTPLLPMLTPQAAAIPTDQTSLE